MKDCLTERPAHFGMLLGYCDHQTHKFMNRLLREYDVSPMQCRTLTFLHDAPGEVNQKNAGAASYGKAQHRQRHRGPAGGKGAAAADGQQDRWALPYFGADGAGNAVL